MVIAGEHLHRIKPSRFEILDDLCKRVRSLFTPSHPEKGVPDMFRVGRTTESHKPALDSSVSRKAFGGDASLFRRAQCPALCPALKVRVLNVSEKKRVPGQHFGFAVDRIVPVKLAHKSHRLLVG